ncbi:MAG: pentapeptide repeat-containing protein, partial [Planctomycetaceae bacterium]|nr:pentapeptide repeat-containing protein [Planctomycetaceae bacterium]
MLKKSLYIVVFVLSSLIVFDEVGFGQVSLSEAALPAECRREKVCSWFQSWYSTVHCVCYYAPALPDDEDKKEYSDKYEASKHVNLYYGYSKRVYEDSKHVNLYSGYLGGVYYEIMLDGKRIVDRPFENVRNFDFKRLHGLFWGDNESGDYARNCSFYGAVLKGSSFYKIDFWDCDFRYANLEDVYFGGVLGEKCNLKGAIILGATLPYTVTPEMVLSTDSFTKREHMELPVCTYVGEIPRHAYTSVVSYVQNGQAQTKKCVVRKQQVVLDRCVFQGVHGKPDFSNFDFNKFNNGEKAPFPCSMQETVFHWSTLKNCKFTDGDIEKAKFINCNLQGSDFSGTNLRMAEFCDSDISNCNFRKADIQGADFTGFYSIKKYIPIASISTLYKPFEYNGKPIATKIEVEQLRTTKNFEDREFLDIKFGVSILRGLNLSRFNL